MYAHNRQRKWLQKWVLPFSILIVGIALRWTGLDGGLSHAYTFHPDEMCLFYAVDKISWQPVFLLSRQVFQELEAENVPSLVIAALQPLHNQPFKGKTEFLMALEQQIGQERTARHKQILFKHERPIIRNSIIYLEFVYPPVGKCGRHGAMLFHGLCDFVSFQNMYEHTDFKTHIIGYPD